MRAPDAILVLGGRLLPSGRPGGAVARRCEAAAREASRWTDAPIIACGGRHWGGVVEADAMARALAALGVPPSRIERERLSLTTIENLVEGRRRARARGAGERLAIVTCAWHLHRAMSIARVLGIEALGVPVPSPRRGVLATSLRASRERVHTAVDVVCARRRR